MKVYSTATRVPGRGTQGFLQKSQVQVRKGWRDFLVQNTDAEKLPRFSSRTFSPLFLCGSTGEVQPNWQVMQWRKRGLGSCSARSCCSTDPKVAEVSGNRSWQNEPTSLAEGTGETSSLNRNGGRATCNRVQHGQVSPARQELIGATLAPKTRETLAELQGRRLQERVREIPEEVMASNPTRVNLDNFTFSKCLSSAPFGQRSWPRRMHLRNAQSEFG